MVPRINTDETQSTPTDAAVGVLCKGPAGSWQGGERPPTSTVLHPATSCPSRFLRSLS
jgi:hypothetical protein